MTPFMLRAVQVRRFVLPFIFTNVVPVDKEQRYCTANKDLKQARTATAGNKQVNFSVKEIIQVSSV